MRWFSSKKGFERALGRGDNAVRAPRKVNVPVVMTREEVARVIPLLNGAPQLVVKLLFGSGLRMMEALRLRVPDIDLQMKTITVRSGKGGKDRVTTFLISVTPSCKPTWYGSS